MKRIFTSAFALFLAGNLSAQITLDQAAYSNVNITSDTFGHINGTTPALDTGANILWDLTQVTYENVRYYSVQDVGSVAGFPTASFYGQRRYSIDSLKFDSKRWSRISATGVERVGEEIKRQALSLKLIAPALNAGTGDSIIVLEQNAAYSVPYPLIKFPATYGSSWSSTYSLSVNMNITLGTTYVNEPMEYRTTTDWDFKVVGYGKVQMRRLDNTGYGEDDVLMLRITGTTKDSFFIGGTPAPHYILSAMNITQGKVTNNNFDELFRKNEVTALVLYSYGNNNFTTANYGEIHQLRIPFPASVESVSADKKMVLYPNPIRGGQQLHVKLPAVKSGNYNYKISRIDGAIAATGFAAGNGNELSVDLPSTLTGGVYWLSLYHNGDVVNVAPFSVNE